MNRYIVEMFKSTYGNALLNFSEILCNTAIGCRKVYFPNKVVVVLKGF